MKLKIVSNNVFPAVIIGAILISLFAFNDAFAAQTVNDRKIINSTSILGDLVADDLFGYQIEAISDLNGDGVIDLAAIKYGDDSGITLDPANNDNAGSILILFMNSNGTVSSTNEITMEDNFTDGIGNVCLNDAANQVDNGSIEQLAFVGDLDGDGEPTLALGANSNDHDYGAGFVEDAGVVYMLELNSDGTVDNCVLITKDSSGFAPDDGVYREADAANFGWPILATDLNGDGQNELLVGANSESNSQTDLWPLFLTSTGTVSSHPDIPISGLSIGVDANVFISDGSSISGTKIIVGSEDHDGGGGSVFIVNLNGTGAFVSSTEIARTSIVGIDNDERFGSGVTPLGDIDGDGINDILVGNEAGDDTNALSGEVHILYLNSDDTLKESQKISNESENTRISSTPFGASDLFGHGMSVWSSSSTEAVIAISAHQDDVIGGSNSGAIFLFYIEITPVETIEENSGGGCDDCTPPTLGTNSHGERMVDGGFSYNGNTVDAAYFHTEFPLINATIGEINVVKIKIYENGGVQNIQNIQFGLGVIEVGKPLSLSEVIILVGLHYNGTSVELIDITDKENLIEDNSVNATVNTIKCKTESYKEDCLLVDLQYSYREAPKYNVMIVTPMDDKRNTWNFYFNDGIQVLGESLNPSPTQNIFLKKTNQAVDNWLSLVRTDKINDVWIDDEGVEYNHNNNNFDRITPYESWTCKDKPLDQVQVHTRNNCNFRALTAIWSH